MFTEEQLARLTPDELITAKRWERERQERDAILTRYFNGELTVKQTSALIRQQAQMCEHGRSILSLHCIGCDEIEAKLYPERFDEEGYRKEDQPALTFRNY